MHQARIGFAFVIAIVTGTALLGAPRAAATPAPVGVGSSFTIEPPVARYVADLDDQELTEQIRDWAVLATVARLGATPAQAAAATYELPPVRLPYLDELYSFEYGRGRRAYLGARVLLFRDADDPDPQATIGRLADRVREENGEIPARVEVYLVHDERNAGTIRVERTPDISARDLFSPAYGYVEAKADTAPQLAAWLARTDDLSFAQIRNGHLVVGGRRFRHTRTAGVSVEDIAALYQAHERLEGPRMAARTQLRALPPEIRTAIERASALAAMNKPDAANDALRAYVRQSRDRLSQVTALVPAIAASTTAGDSPGFSLDPESIADPGSSGHPLLLTRLRAFASHPCAELEALRKRGDDAEQTEPEPTRRTSAMARLIRLRGDVVTARAYAGAPAVCASLEAAMPALGDILSTLAAAGPADWEAADMAYHRFIKQQHTAEPLANILIDDALNYYESDTRTQCARYTGTAGTQIGMTMFYTDLLMKLWMSTDHDQSAPILDVAGFLSEPHIRRSALLGAASDQHESTRYWFGPRSGNVSRRPGPGHSLLFRHDFTRLYAAGRGPQWGDAETRPGERARRAGAWWDHHYDNVADYEQEFHRLNQIMKWSLVTGALTDLGAAPELRAVPVDHGDDLDHWLHANQARLRLTSAIPVSRTTVAGKECLPIFESIAIEGSDRRILWTIYGGVGTTSLAAAERVPVVDPALPLGGRSAPAVSLGGAGAELTARPTMHRSGTAVAFEHARDLAATDGVSTIELGAPEVRFQAGVRPGQLETIVGEPAHPIGRAVIDGGDARVRMTWRDGAVEADRYGGATPANDLAEADQRAVAGDVVDAEAFYEQAPGGKQVTQLAQAREIAIDAAHRRPEAVLKAVQAIQRPGTQLPAVIQTIVARAAANISKPSAAAYLQDLAEGRALVADDGVLVAERGKIALSRDIEVMPATPAVVPPATDLSQRGIYLDRNLRIGQEGAIPDLGTRAARWQSRPRVRMSELREQRIGRLADRLTETTTGATFDYIPPRSAPANSVHLPPLMIRQCDDQHRTPETNDDC